MKRHACLGPPQGISEHRRDVPRHHPIDVEPSSTQSLVMSSDLEEEIDGLGLAGQVTEVERRITRASCLEVGHQAQGSGNRIEYKIMAVQISVEECPATGVI